MSTAPETSAAGKQTVALVIPTKDKLRHLRQTLPINAKIGFDEVLVVDSSVREKAEVQKLCTDTGAKYVFTPLDRLGARNLGAKLAITDWVCIIDDDIILRKFDLDKFRSHSAGLDFMFGGWALEDKGIHYAWIFKRSFFLDTVKGYDPMITGGDDLDITLRSKKLGKGEFVFDKDIYIAEPIGLGIAKQYPEKWIRNKALYALTYFPLVKRHPFLIRNILLADGWRIQRMIHGEGAGRIVFESFIDRSGQIFGPAYYLLNKRKSRGLS